MPAGGALDRHTLSLSGNAVANARIYVSVPDGRVLRLEKEMVLNITITSSARTKRFVQKSTSVAELDR